MNPKLATLFEQYQFSQKDIYDFMQIYNLMPDYKKVRAIENFEDIAQSISHLKTDLLTEHEIFILKNFRKDGVSNTAQKKRIPDRKYSQSSTSSQKHDVNTVTKIKIQTKIFLCQ